MPVAILVYDESRPRFGIEKQEYGAFNLVVVTKTTEVDSMRKNIGQATTIHGLPVIDFHNLSDLVGSYVSVYGCSGVSLMTSDETCILVSAQVRETFGIPGPGLDRCTRFINKVRMKESLKGACVAMPRYLAFNKQTFKLHEGAYLNEVHKHVGFPAFVKPIDKAGSYGVRRLDSIEETKKWATEIINDALEYEMDEYISGALFHCESIIVQDKVLYACASMYNQPWEAFSHGAIVGSLLLNDDHPLKTKLLEFNALVVRALCPPDGVTHLEVFVRPNGECVFLEIAARPPGAFHVRVHECNTGINLEEAHFRAQLGLNIEVRERNDEEHYAGAALPKKKGKVNALLEPSLEGLASIEWHVSVGDELEASTSLAVRSEAAGMLTLRHTNYEQLKETFLRLNEFEFLKMEP